MKYKKKRIKVLYELIEKSSHYFRIQQPQKPLDSKKLSLQLEVSEIKNVQYNDNCFRLSL